MEKYMNKGLTGLANVGNSCYINSCMQIISHTYELNEFLNLELHRRIEKNTSLDTNLLIEWDNLRKMMWQENMVISPNRYIDTIQRVAKFKGHELFTEYYQNDIEEFFLFIIDTFHEALKRKLNIRIKGIPENETDKLAIKCYEVISKTYKNEYSEMLDLFYGVHVSQIRCKNTNELLSSTPEMYSIISLPIPKIKEEVNILDCFDMYCKEELMSGENSWYNEELNKKMDVNKEIKFWNLPKILIVSLKRWNETGRKINKKVNLYLNELDLSKFVVGYKPKSYKYELYGVCNHSGGSMGGHYTSSIKTANGKWYNFNDTNVKNINEKEIISGKSYCFFYRKKK